MYFQLIGSKHTDQSPNLRYKKGDNKAHYQREESSNGRPFFAARFFINGVDGGAARVMEQGEEHEVNGR